MCKLLFLLSFILQIFPFAKINSTCRYCQSVFAVKVILRNGVHEKGFVEFHPENEFEELETGFMEVIRKKGYLRFYYIDDEIKLEALPHSLYNRAYYDIPFSSISRFELLKK